VKYVNYESHYAIFFQPQEIQEIHNASSAIIEMEETFKISGSALMFCFEGIKKSLSF
jgi:hypothetical protein